MYKRQPQGRLNDLLGQGRGVAHIAAHQVRAAHLHQLPAGERPDGLEVLAHPVSYTHHECEAPAFSREELLTIAGRQLNELARKTKERLGWTLTVTGEGLADLVAQKGEAGVGLSLIHI